MRGPVVALLRVLRVVPPGGRLLGASVAVIGGLTYELPPFIVLVMKSLKIEGTIHVEPGLSRFSDSGTRFSACTTGTASSP